MSKQPDFRIFLGLAAASVLIGGFMVYSQWNSVSEQQARVDDVQKQVDDAAGVRKELADSEERLSQLKIKLAHLEKGVPDYRYIPTLLAELEKFGNANGIHVTAVRPMAAKPSAKPDEKATRKAYDEYTVEVKGRGTYADGLRFLRALHRFPKVVAARTVSLQPRVLSNDPAGAGPNLEMTVELQLFVFPEAKEPATAAGEEKPASSVAVSEVGSNG
ncbi:MAG: type 4a pilus biogenesis protein PilO [Fimbriimonas sp.]